MKAKFASGLTFTKKNVSFFGLFVVMVSCLFVPMSVASDQKAKTPSSTLKELFELTQTNADWAVLAEYLDWGSVMQDMPDWMLKRYGLASPDKTREFCLTFLKDPAHAVRVQYHTGELMADSEDQETITRLKAALAGINEAPRKKIAELRQVLQSAQFEIGTETVQGASAKVNLVVYSEDAMRDVQMAMLQTNGQWRLVMPQLNRFLARVFNEIDSDAAYQEIEALEGSRKDREKKARMEAKEVEEVTKKALEQKSRENGLKAELSFIVVDDSGKPIPDARVQWLQCVGSEGDARPVGLTDKEGGFKAVSSKWSNNFLLWKVTCSGYEDQVGPFVFESIGETHWIPADKTIRVVLKEAEKGP